jgi:hypothetical protein
MAGSNSTQQAYCITQSSIKYVTYLSLTCLQGVWSGLNRSQPFDQWALRMWAHVVVQSAAWPDVPPLMVGDVQFGYQPFSVFQRCQTFSLVGGDVQSPAHAKSAGNLYHSIWCSFLACIVSSINYAWFLQWQQCPTGWLLSYTPCMHHVVARHAALTDAGLKPAKPISLFLSLNTACSCWGHVLPPLLVLCTA